MATKEQEYISGIYKNIGFAFLSPIGAIVFQYLIFEKPFSLRRFLICLCISLFSWGLFYLGYNEIREKKYARK